MRGTPRRRRRWPVEVKGEETVLFRVFERVFLPLEIETKTHLFSSSKKKKQRKPSPASPRRSSATSSSSASPLSRTSSPTASLPPWLPSSAAASR